MINTRLADKLWKRKGWWLATLEIFVKETFSFFDEDSPTGGG